PGASFVHAASADDPAQDGDAAPAPPATTEEPSADERAPSEPPAAVTAPPAPKTSAPALDALQADKQGLPLVAVLDLRASDGSEALASALATVVAAELAARDDVRAVSRNELQALVTHKAEQALLGGESVKCAADLGKLVEADLVITGAVERAGEAYVFSLSLIDPVVGDVKERV